MLTKLRSGSNFLRIETGRRKGLSSEERKCWFGCGVTENERHFLLQCHLYDDLRKHIRIDERGEEAGISELGQMLGNCNKEQLVAVLVFIKRTEARRRRYVDYHV